MDGQLRFKPVKHKNRDDYHLLSANKFPWKLWKIVRDCGSGAIKWSDDGKNVVLHKIKFQREYLDPHRKTFKTKNIGSFVRQLNLYGFKKVQPTCKQFQFDTDLQIQEFHNEFFQKGRPDLVNELRRHVGIRRAREQAAKRHFPLCDVYRNMTNETPLSTNCYPKVQKKIPTITSSIQYTVPTIRYGDEALTSMLAVPIYSDGIPYIHPSLPPVLIEYEQSARKWVPRGPVAGASVVSQPKEYMPEGAHLTVSSEEFSSPTFQRGEFDELVTVLSEALKSMPDPCQQISQPCQNTCQTWRNAANQDYEELYHNTLLPTSHKRSKTILPGQSLLRTFPTPRSSSPNSPSSAACMRDVFAPLNLSPIIVPCEGTLVHAAMTVSDKEQVLEDYFKIEDILNLKES